MNAFTIKDLENLSGIKAHTIRIWEQRYSFLNPQRTQTNIRYYSNTELQTILNIALLNKYGYKISHINRMTFAEMNDTILSLPESGARQERTVNQLLQAMMELQMENFESILDDHIDEKGIEHTITQTILPFLDRIGILWLTKHMQPAQEHLVSNIIRQKLILGIENIHVKDRSGKKALLFLPEGEHHELALLFVQYLLKKKGIQVWYMGTDTPLEDAVYIANVKKPSFLYTHLTAPANNFNLEKYLNRLHKQIPGRKLIVSGMFIEGYKRKIPANTIFIKSLAEVRAFIDSL